MSFSLIGILAITSFKCNGQNELIIPSTIESDNINLTLEEGSTEFYPGLISNTMGANGALLGPTLILNQGDFVNITVENQLSDTTTIHWHGMHVSPENDGGPHTAIAPQESWNPQFTVLDKAGLYWYHPHLHMHTDEHVSKGIAGLIMVRDGEEAGLDLPMTYGVDEFPIVMQTKGFDEFGQILVHTDLDTAVMVNGTVNTFTNFPAQVVRLRVLNGSSQRVMEIGFSDDRSFDMIGTDGGLLAAPVNLTRYRMSPGQRADILVDLSSSIGDDFRLMSFGSELPNALYGASQPGMGPGATSSLPDYTSNPLNGNDFALLEINVVAPTESPILSIPTSLAAITPLLEGDADVTRNLTFTAAGSMMDLGGPFLINGSNFDMETINYTIPLGNIEIWSLTNQTPIAHPFHIHDVQFFILDINGASPPPQMQGLNDVVMVPGGMGNVRFIAQFSDFSDDDVAYMYHCHMLPHEDEGMMGQFLVVDPSASIDESVMNDWKVFPNPSGGEIYFRTNIPLSLSIQNLRGEIIKIVNVESSTQYNFNLAPGVYILIDSMGGAQRLIVQ